MRPSLPPFNDSICRITVLFIDTLFGCLEYICQLENTLSRMKRVGVLAVLVSSRTRRSLGISAFKVVPVEDHGPFMRLPGACSADGARKTISAT